MSKYTRKEFAALCHTTIGVINMNVKRGNIIVEQKKINIDEPSNKDFFSKYQKKHEEKLKFKSLEKELKPDIKEKKELTSSNEADTISDKSNDYILRKKKADALKSEREAEKLLLQVRKMSGDMIPTEMVKLILKTMCHSIFSSFSSKNENLATLYCDVMAGGDREYLSEINDKLDKSLQEIINKSKEVAKKDIDNVIKEFANTRTRGQKK